MKREIEVIPIYYDYVLTTDYPVYILVGGRNSGKSHFMEQQAVINMHNKSDYKLLVIEDVETNIGAGVKAGIEERTEEFGYDPVFSQTKNPPEITHRNGSKTIFRGYHSKQQQKQVKSLNSVTAAWYEEGENITYEQFKALRMQLRGGDKEDRKLYITMNPVNPDSYINQEFFQKPPDKVFEYFDDGRPKVFERNIGVEIDGASTDIPCMVVVSTHWDNPYLTPEQRADIEELKHSNKDLWEMLANGKFVRPSNTYFMEFNPGIHVVDPFVIPDHWNRYLTVDYGLDKLAALWIAEDERGASYVYKMIYESDLIITEAAKRILEVNDGDRLTQRYAPPDLWSRTKDTGKSIVDGFREGGVTFRKSDNSRVPGWLAVKEYLKVYETRDIFTGEPKKNAKLKIFRTCTDLIRTLPQLLTSDKNPNDVANEPHELTHAPDALRGYCIMRRGRTIKPAAPRNRSETFQRNTTEEVNFFD